MISVWSTINKVKPLRLVLWLYAAISIYPLFWMIAYSLKDNNEIFYTNPFGFPRQMRFENYAMAFDSFNVGKYIMNSVLVTSATIIVAVIVSLLFSYSIARLRWKLRGFARIYIMIGMFVPLQAFLIPLVILVKDLQLLNSYTAMILPYISFNLAFNSIILYGFFKSIPIEYEEAACMDGASIYRTFYSIIMPMVKPAIVSIVILMFIGVWNEFTFAYVITTKEQLKTLPLGILNFDGQFQTNWGALGAVMTIASLPAIVVYLLFNEKVEQAMNVGAGIKG